MPNCLLRAYRGDSDRGFESNFETQVQRLKTKEGAIDRILDQNTLIVKDLFKAETRSEVYLKKPIEIEGTGNQGII